MAFDAVEPIGESRRDFRAAMQMALLANVNRDEKKRKKPFSYEDFLPDWWGDRQLDEDAVFDALVSKIEAANTQMGGMDLRTQDGDHRTNDRQADTGR